MLFRSPFGGSDARFGTNPCTIGIPLEGQPPFILDMATSAVAQGKVRVAHNKGEKLAPGLLLDDRGKHRFERAPKDVIARRLVAHIAQLYGSKTRRKS